VVVVAASPAMAAARAATVAQVQAAATGATASVPVTARAALAPPVITRWDSMAGTPRPVAAPVAAEEEAVDTGTAEAKAPAAAEGPAAGAGAEPGTRSLPARSATCGSRQDPTEPEGSSSSATRRRVGDSDHLDLLRLAGPGHGLQPEPQRRVDSPEEHEPDHLTAARLVDQHQRGAHLSLRRACGPWRPRTCSSRDDATTQSRALARMLAEGGQHHERRSRARRRAIRLSTPRSWSAPSTSTNRQVAAARSAAASDLCSATASD
jgi:hypothetical protein